MQEDLFEDVPFLQPTSREASELRRGPGILLTPTCDFALKQEHPLRQVASTIRPLFAIVPPQLEQHRQELDQIIERIGTVLQEKTPVQVTRELLKHVGLNNLIRE